MGDFLSGMNVNSPTEVRRLGPILYVLVAIDDNQAQGCRMLSAFIGECCPFQSALKPSGNVDGNYSSCFCFLTSRSRFTVNR